VQEGEYGYNSSLSLTSVLDGVVVSGMSRPLYPREREPAPIVREAWWSPGLAWTGAEYIASTRIRFTVRPARSESLFRLRYPDPRNSNNIYIIKIYLVKSAKCEVPDDVII
jgi:hypothetical protein